MYLENSIVTDLTTTARQPNHQSFFGGLVGVCLKRNILYIYADNNMFDMYCREEVIPMTQTIT